MAASWEPISSARTPDGGDLVLYRRGGEYMIRAGGLELMSSRAHGSEGALAELACRELPVPGRVRVLIGGLGLGYTLRAALTALPSDALVDLVELIPEVADWHRRFFGPLTGKALDDPRVTVTIADVAQILRKASSRYHAVILDVDNGPAYLIREDNAVLYREMGLRWIYRALTSGGVLAVWSAAPDKEFAARLRGAGFAVRMHKVPARGEEGDPRHTVYIAKR